MRVSLPALSSVSRRQLRRPRRTRSARKGGPAAAHHCSDQARHPLARYSKLEAAAQESAITGMEMKLGDFAAQIFRAPDQANPPDKIQVGVEKIR